jgi:hypothetical protein
MISITTPQLSAFLQHQGWEKLGVGIEGESWVWPTRPDSPAVLVPKEGDEAPYHHDLLEVALQRLQLAMGLAIGELIDQIITTFGDRLEVRVRDPTTAEGLIPLDRGAQLAESLRVIISNGARLQFAGGKLAYSGGLPDSAKDVLSQIKMMPPSAGSFRFTVQAPTNQQLTFGTDSPADPVHETFVSALRALDATRETTEGPIPDDADELDEAVSRGMSSNLVKAVRLLDTESTALHVEFKAYWSRRETAVPDCVQLDAKHFAQLGQLERVLKHFNPQKNFALHGWIKEVEADALAKPGGPLAGTVTVQTRIAGKQRDVRVELSGDQLQHAGAGVGQQFLNATGTLERIGRSWFLMGPKEIRLRGEH